MNMKLNVPGALEIYSLLNSIISKYDDNLLFYSDCIIKGETDHYDIL